MKRQPRKPAPKPADTAKVLEQMKALYTPRIPGKESTTNDKPNPEKAGT